LVRASRKPVLEQLSQSEVSKLVTQARKHFRKWRDLGRTQARVTSKKVGMGEKPANTRLKVQIFEEAMKSLEAHLASFDGAGAKKKNSGPTKQDRTAEHRATRAAIRKGMTAAEDLVNQEKFKKRNPIANTSAKAASIKPTPAKSKPAKAAAAKAPAKKPAASAPAKSTAKAGRPGKRPALNVPSAIDIIESRSLTTLVPPKKLRSSVALLNKTNQRRAMAAAKGSRVARSGKTTRTLGHVQARGQRNQARRDAKN